MKSWGAGRPRRTPALRRYPGTVRAIQEIHDQLVVRFAQLTEAEAALLRDCCEVLDYHHYGWTKGERYGALRESIEQWRIAQSASHGGQS